MFYKYKIGASTDTPEIRGREPVFLFIFFLFVPDVYCPGNIIF